MKLDAALLSISFTSSSHGDGYVNVRLRDKVSGIEFFDGSLSFEEFGKALACRAERPMFEAEVRGIENINKKHEWKSATIEAPELGYHREAYEQWLAENGGEEGWKTSTYLGSRESIGSPQDGKRLLKYTLHRYV